MGHRRFAGYVREVQIAGAGMLRLDVYTGDATEAVATQFLSPASIYALTPTTEALARRLALHERPEPVARFELPALPAADEPDDQEDAGSDEEYPDED